MRRALAVPVLLFLVACPKITEERRAADKAAAPEKKAPSQRVRVAGSEAMRRLASRLGETYSKANADVAVDVQGGGTTAGLTALADGAADIAQASRRISDAEKAQIESKRGAAVVETPIAFDAIAIYVNHANPVKELSLRQLAGIFNGTTKSWRAVGGPNAPITIYGQADAASFTSYLGAGEIQLQPIKDFADARGAIAAVAADPNGIAYAMAVPATQARVVWIQQTDGGIAVAPSEKSIGDRSYPLSGRMYFYSTANAPEPARRFIDWTKSENAKPVLAETGYVRAQ